MSAKTKQNKQNNLLCILYMGAEQVGADGTALTSDLDLCRVSKHLHCFRTIANTSIQSASVCSPCMKQLTLVQL